MKHKFSEAELAALVQMINPNLHYDDLNDTQRSVIRRLENEFSMNIVDKRIRDEDSDYVKGSDWVAEAEDRSHDRFMNMMGKINPDE